LIPDCDNWLANDKPAGPLPIMATSVLLMYIVFLGKAKLGLAKVAKESSELVCKNLRLFIIFFWLCRAKSVAKL